MRQRLISFLAFVVCLGPVSAAWAHEDQNTHPGLTSVMFQLLEDYWNRHNLNLNRRPTIPDILSAREGSIKEDLCPRYYSHFYNPNTPTLAGSNVEPIDLIDRNCSWTNTPGSATYFVQQLATWRAAELWDCAIQTYRGNDCVEPTLGISHPAGLASAFILLGHVLHLLEDMTSPAHVHNDPHGKPGFQGLGDCKGQDADDFENWGWCISRGSPLPDADHGHIRDYVTRPPAAPEQMTARLKNNLQTLYQLNPQGVPGSLDPVVQGRGENIAAAFVRHVAELSYHFTTFRVRLYDRTSLTDVQPLSELRRMVRGSTNEGLGGINNCGTGTIDNGLCDVGGAFTISGNLQEVGRSEGFCGRSERGDDSTEEWWLMEDGSMGICTQDTSGLGNLLESAGFAYIENTGGEGQHGTVDADSFVPEQYGCDPWEEDVCDGTRKAKRLFRALYGTKDNDGKTMLRIYGDIMYSVAVAYGAGLIHTFLEEVGRPVADVGGPYTGEACTPISFDASGSKDFDGTIVSYDWDFTSAAIWDGIYDQTTSSPFVEYTYQGPQLTKVRLQVTDNDGLKDVDIADVTVGPDRTPPDLSKLTVTPGLLWPPDHKPVQVTLEPNASDACGPPTCRILSVVSSDPVTSRSDHTSPDFEITGDLTLWLRSERAGTGTGRVYTITLECTDAAGNSATKSIDVTVPHSASPADTPVPPAPPVVVDLDIAQFRVTNRVSVSRAQSIDITLVVDDTTDPTGPANATVVGVQGGVQVYRETLVVSDSPGRGKTTFEFPGFTPVKAGDIAWTAAINDTDPDVDRAEDTTRVVP